MNDHSDEPVSWPRPEESVPRQPIGGALIGALWEARRRLVAAGGAGVILGVLVSYAMPSYFTSSVSFIPEEQATATLPGGLSGLAAQFGVATGTPTRSPEFYARLVNGRHIREALAATTFADGQTLVGYYGFGGEPDSIDRTVRKMGNDYSVSVDRATSIVRVDVELRDPQFAAEIANAFVAQVDSFNIQLRRSSARERRIFAEARMGEAQSRLTEAEAELRDFLTRNRAGNAPALKFEQGRLERRVSMAQELYLNLARGAQTARLDEVNGTPVISIVAPAFVPVRRSRPRRLMVGFLAGVLAAVATASLVLAQRLRGDVDVA